ncbi:hypothetical protein HOG21_02370 [bacterium]|nr:hypothetical protein [bacterium]
MLFIYSSILFNIESSLSSFLFINSSPVSGSVNVPVGKVSQVFGLYILPNSLSIAFSFDSSKNTTL